MSSEELTRESKQDFLINTILSTECPVCGEQKIPPHWLCATCNVLICNRVEWELLGEVCNEHVRQIQHCIEVVKELRHC